MTPRERLEAAGWKARYPEAEARWFSPDISDSATYSQKEALAQLARDGAKETSDGSVKEKVQLETVSVPYVSSPVAGNVATQGYAQNSVQAAPVATSVSAPESAEQFYAKSAFNFVWYRSNGDIFEFAEAYAREYSSSSSAAPKWDENGILWWAGIGHISVFQRNQDVRKIEAERDALRDSRDRLHEEFDVMRLRALSAEKIARIPIRTQDEEFIARRAALDPVPDTE